jgi:hypothetical protein
MMLPGGTLPSVAQLTVECVGRRRSPDGPVYDPARTSVSAERKEVGTSLRTTTTRMTER